MCFYQGKLYQVCPRCHAVNAPQLTHVEDEA